MCKTVYETNSSSVISVFHNIKNYFVTFISYINVTVIKQKVIFSLFITRLHADMTLYAQCVSLWNVPRGFISRGLCTSQRSRSLSAAYTCALCVSRTKVQTTSTCGRRGGSKYLSGAADIFAPRVPRVNRVPVANLCLKGSLTTLLRGPKNVGVKAGD